MKSLTTLSLTLLSAFIVTIDASAAASSDAFRGRWSRDCGNGQTCHLAIDYLESRRDVDITFSIEGTGRQPCHWTVKAAYNKDFGGPFAYDPYGNYGFYVKVLNDGRLYASGTMLPICDTDLPLEQYYTSDTKPSTDNRPLADNRETLDHNGSSVVVDPAAGTIVYDYPKASIARTVKPGALLFKAVAPWNPDDDKAVIQGTAFVFKRGCEPAPYAVSGHYEEYHTLVLRGAAPVRERNGCGVLGYKMNGNSVLSFVSLGD